jgi:hypothetical protein
MEKDETSRGSHTDVYSMRMSSCTTSGANTMLNRFKEMGIPIKIIRLINKTQNNSKAQIAEEDKLTPTLEINAGVRQGDPLSALLCNLTLESVI